MGADPRFEDDLTKDVVLGELGRSLSFLMRISQVRVFEHFYATFGEDGLRPGEFSVLWVVHKNPDIRQGVLAQTLRIKPAHMTKMIRRLEEQSLLTRRIPDDDRRSVLLRLTPAGEDFVAGHRDRFFGLDAYLKHSLSPEETAQLANLLKKFTELRTKDIP